MTNQNEEIPWTEYHEGIIRYKCSTCGGALGHGHACWMPYANDIRRIVREELERFRAESRTRLVNCPYHGLTYSARCPKCEQIKADATRLPET